MALLAGAFVFNLGSRLKQNNLPLKENFARELLLIELLVPCTKSFALSF